MRPVFEVGIPGSRDRQGRFEVIKEGEESHAIVSVSDEVLQKEEVDVTRKVLEQIEKIRVSGEHFAQRALTARVMAPDAFHGVIKSVADLLGAATRLVDRPLPVNPNGGKHHHSANRVSETSEIHFILRYAIDCSLLERWNNGVTRQAELPETGTMTQVKWRPLVIEIEHLTVGKLLAP